MSLPHFKSSFSYTFTYTAVNWFLDTFYDFSTSGTDYIPCEGSVIFASNHVSFYDPPVAGAHVNRQLNYFARDTLFKGLLGKFMRSLDTIPVTRDSADIKSLKAIFKVLKKGGAIMIFPEGTRSHDGQLSEPKPGTGMIACKSKSTIIPTRIFGTFEVFGRHKTFPTFGGPIHVSFGQPVDAATIDPGPEHPKRYLEASHRIMAKIAKLKAPETTVV